MEAFLAERSAGMAVPIDVEALARQRFHVRAIHTGIRRASYAARLQPIRGGFEVYTRLTWRQRLSLYAVLSHECAHTFFFAWQGRDRVPAPRPCAFKEKLCDYGQRALLMPREHLPGNLLTRCTLPPLLAAASKMGVRANWLAERLLLDLRIEKSCAFLAFERGVRGLRRNPYYRSVIPSDLRLGAAGLGAIKDAVADSLGRGRLKGEDLSAGTGRTRYRIEYLEPRGPLVPDVPQAILVLVRSYES